MSTDPNGPAPDFDPDDEFTVGDPPDADETLAVESGENILDALRRRRENMLAGDREEWFFIPGYGEQLVGLFRPLPFETIQQVVKPLGKKGRAKKGTAEGALADFIGWSCHALAVVKSDGSRAGIETTVPGDADTPVRFGDPRLAVALGFGYTPKTARESVRATIPDDTVLAAFQTAIMEWMQDPDDDGGDDGSAFVGESGARR